MRLFWNPDRTFDLGKPWARRWMYENVRREAIRVNELCAWLDEKTLIREWSELHLPKAVRMAWEAQHPVLHSAATAA